MKKNLRLGLILVLAVGLPAAALAMAFYLASRDDPPPKDDDLCPTRLDIPDAENGFTYFIEAAAKSWEPERQESKRLDPETGEEVPWEQRTAHERYSDMADGLKWDEALTGEVLQRNAEALALLERGLACPAAQGPEIKTLMDEMPYLLGLVALSRVLDLRAQAKARRGDHAGAFADAVMAVRFGHAVEGSGGCTTTWLVGATIKSRGFACVRRLVAGPAGVPPAHLKRLASDLAPFGARTEGLAEAFRVEYTGACWAIEEIASGRMGMDDIQSADLLRTRRRALTRPFLLKPNRTKARFTALYRSLIRNTSRPYGDLEPSAVPQPLQPSIARVLAGNVLGDILFNLLVPSLEALVHQKCHKNVEVGATRTLLAMRAYALEKGRLPLTLEELVPDYLDAVPLDGFDGQPLRYNPDKKVVYSVGKDLKDDGGMTAEEARQWWRQEDPYTAKEQPDPEPVCLPDPSWPIEF
jgi:hypothetical protein